MKHTRLTTALLLILTVFIITSCKKDDPEPSMGDQVAGNYTITRVALGPLGLDYPFTDTDGVVTSGKIEVKKVTDDTASAIITETEKDKTGKTTETKTDLGTANLKKATTGEIEAYLGTTKIGTYTGGTLTISFADPSSGIVYTITSKK